MIKFIMPILSLEKPKQLSITMANTMFGAMSGAQPVNWGRLIQEYVEKSIPHIGQKPSFLPPYILHLYQQYGCINAAEEDALTIAEDKVVYKLGPDVEITEAGTEESSEDPFVPEPPHPLPFRKPGEQPLRNPATRPVPVESNPGRILTCPTSSFRKPPSNESGLG